MKVNSSKLFRKWVKEKEHRSEVDENFMGYGYDEGNTHTHGFFNLFHGIKDDIAGYLTPRLDLAQDNQAIYEFVQNAADCKSTHFFSFWNDDFFLVCNNGDKFTYAGLESILNEGQSTKRSPDSIGRYGVGFKIIHRLVGEHNGLQEIMHKDCGPIVFSWSKKDYLLDFLNGSSPELLSEHDESAPYLLKILLTNFPSDVDETVLDCNHQSRIVFRKEELNECQSYAKQCLESYLNEDADWEQGSIFFLRLGKGKKAVLDNDYHDLSDSLSYSMNTLKKLTSICVNGKDIIRKQLNIEDGVIATNSEQFKHLTIDEKYKEYDVRYSFGFIPFVDVNDLSELSTLKNSPNFYKFFPISDEINSFAMFLHCDTFGISTSRRSLDCTEHNKTILTSMSEFIKQKLDGYKQEDIEKYNQLFIAILLSDRPIKSNNSWQDAVFYQPLLTYIKQNTPTCNNAYRLAAEVKIKGTALTINPSEIGANYDWFIYDDNKESEWQKAAKDTSRIGLQVKDIKGLVKDGTIEMWNAWIETHHEQVEALLEELKEADSSVDFTEKLKQLKFFSTKSGKYSWNAIIGNDNLILLSDNTAPIKDVLEKLGFECTNEVLNEGHPLWKHLQKKNEKYIFSLITKRLATNESLTCDEKIRLVTARFDEVGDETIKQTTIFHNQNGELSVMKRMLPYQVAYPTWMNQYVISENEYSPVLDKFLVPTDRVFEDIVCNYYPSIVQSISEDKTKALDTLFAQFEKNWTDGFTDRLLNNYGANESLLSIIEARKGCQESFLRKLSTINLEPDKDYLFDSFEYRLLRLSVNNEANTEILKDKIIIENKTLRQYTYADTITIRQFKGHTIADIVLSLSDILPHIQTSDAFSKIAAKFPSASNLFIKQEMSIDNIFTACNAYNSYTNAQRLFVMLYAGYRNAGFLPNLKSFKDTSDYLSFVEYLLEMVHKMDQLYEVIDAYAEPLNGFSDKKIYIFAKPYTIESEQADCAVENWVGQDEEKLSFIKRFGYKDSNCDELTRRRKYINGDAQDYSITDSSTNRAFMEWAITNPCPATDYNQIEVLRSICKEKYGYAQEFVDVDKLKSESVEWDDEEYKKWSAGKGYKIFLYSGKMPLYGRYTKLDNSSVRLYEVGCGDYKREGDNLYVNNTTDISQVLVNVTTDSSAHFFTKDDWNTIFRSATDLAISLAKENELLKSENENLRRRLEATGATMGGTRGDGIPTKEQIERSEKAKSLVLEHLQSKGFEVSHVNSDWSVIDGVEKDGISYPLVVKNCENWDNKIYMNPNEWKQLFRPNSMLLLHRGNRVVTPIKANELFSYQDKLTLSFDTKNLMNDERVNKIMEVMQYFDSVHLDLATLSPDTHRGETLDDYLFNSNNSENSDLEESSID